MRSITKNSGDYDEKYMKIKFLIKLKKLNKTIEIPTIRIVFQPVFHENIKQTFS